MIIEATSGNTGIAFSAIGRALGHPVTIFMPDWMSQERKNLIRSLGAKIRLVSKEEGGFLGSIRLAEDHAATPRARSSLGSSPTRTTSTPTSARRGPRSGGSSACRASGPTPSSPVWGRAGPSWARAGS